MGVKSRTSVWVLALAVAAGSLPRVAAAAPRRIAVLNAASDGATGARAAAALRRALLVEQSELSPLAAGDLSRALEEVLPSETESDLALRQARGQLDAAQEAMAQFEPALARRALARAESLLLAVPPDDAVVQLLAEVSFQAGLVHLSDQNRGLAVDAFRQTLRLAPERRRLDPARYPPEVVQAFEAARGSAGGPGALDVSATFDGVPVYLDGVRVGVTPLRTEIAPGPHYLVLAAAEFLPQGRKLDPAPRERMSLVVELERLPLARRAAELRRRLARHGPEREELRRAGREVALLSGVDAVLVVSDPHGAPAVAVYERNADRLSLFRPVDGQVSRVFGLLLPAPGPAPLDLLPLEDREKPVAWYLRPWAVGALSGGAIAVVLGAILLTTAPDSQAQRNGVFDPF
jgi:hypothetical protein